VVGSPVVMTPPISPAAVREYLPSYVPAYLSNGVVSDTRGVRNGYATTYFPGTTVVSAAVPLDLRDDATASIAFAPVVLAQVTGTAYDGDAPLVGGTARFVESPRQGSIYVAPRTATIRSDGSFVFRNVAPGNYVVHVRGDGPGRTGLFVAQAISVGSDRINLNLKTSYGTGLEGRLLFEGDPEHVSCLAPAALVASVGLDNCAFRSNGSYTMRALPLEESARADAQVVLGINGNEFFATNLFGRISFALVNAPDDNWYVKSFTVNGTDIADSGFDFGSQPGNIDNAEIVLSRNGASIAGRRVDTPANNTGYFVLVFPDSSDRLRLPIEAGNGIGIRLHLHFPPFSIPRHRQGQSVTHAGLHLFQHIVPLPDLPAVYRDNRISLANAGSRRGLVREHFSDDGSPKGLQRMGGLEPLLEGVWMDRENHCLPSIQIDPDFGGRDVGDLVHDLVPGGDRITIDPRDLRPGSNLLQRRGLLREPLGEDASDGCDWIDLPTVLVRQKREHCPGKKRVHGDPGQNHHHSLPDGLGLEHPVGRHHRSGRATLERTAADVLLAAGHLHVPAEGQPGDRVLGLTAPEGEPGDRRTQSEGEAVHVNPGPFGGEEVPCFVDEHQDAKNDDQRQYSEQHQVSTLWRAVARAQRSAALTASTEVAGAG